MCNFWYCTVLQPSTQSENYFSNLCEYTIPFIIYHIICSVKPCIKKLLTSYFKLSENAFIFSKKRYFTDFLLYFLKFQIWNEWYLYTMCCKLHYLRAPLHRYERLKNKKVIEGTLDHKQLNYNSTSLTSSEAKTTVNLFHLPWCKWKWQQVLGEAATR